VIPDRAETVQRAFQMVLRGIGQHRVAEVFNRGGVPVFGSSSRKAPKHWHASFIFRLMVNPAVVGVFIPHRNDYVNGKKTRTPMEPVQGYFPAIIDAPTWDGVQALVMGGGVSAKRGRHAKASGLVNLLAGLARCPLCVSSMTLVNKGAKVERKLVCSKARAAAGCKYKSVSYPTVESALLNQIYWLLNDAPAQSEEEARIRRELDSVDTVMDLTSEHLRHLLEAVEQGLSTPAVQERLRTTEAQLEDLRGQEKALRSRWAAVDNTLLDYKVNRVSDIARGQPLDRQAFNAALRGLFQAVVIDYQRGELVFQWIAGGQSEIMYQWPNE